jgi:hypothetical protein
VEAAVLGETSGSANPSASSQRAAEAAPGETSGSATEEEGEQAACLSAREEGLWMGRPA